MNHSQITKEFTHSTPFDRENTIELSRADRLKLLAGTIGAFLLLAYVYASFISTTFAYAGYNLAFSSSGFATSIILLSFFVVAVGHLRLRFFSRIVAVLMLFGTLIPMAILCSFSGRSAWYFSLCVLASFLALVFSTIDLLRIQPKPVMNPIQISHVLLAIGALFVLLAVAKSGASGFSLDFARVYEYRMSSSETFSGIWGYILPTVGKVVLPMALAIFVFFRRFWLVSICAFLSILLFGATSHKGVVFYPLMVLTMYWMLKSGSATVRVMYSFLALICIGVLFVVAWNWLRLDSLLLWASISLRRALFIPADVNFAYFEYFSQNPFMSWANISFFGLGGGDERLIAMSRMIGLFRFDNVDTVANTGWLGSGYGQAGIVGMFVYALTLGVLLQYCDQMCSNNPLAPLVSAALLVPFATLLTSADLPTTFLTHGLLVALFLSYQLRPTSNS